MEWSCFCLVPSHPWKSSSDAAIPWICLPREQYDPAGSKVGTSYQVWGDQPSLFAWDWGGPRLRDWDSGPSVLKWRWAQVNKDALVTLVVRTAFLFSQPSPLLITCPVNCLISALLTDSFIWVIALQAKSQLCHVLATELWANCSTSLSLRFLLSQMRVFHTSCEGPLRQWHLHQCLAHPCYSSSLPGSHL